MSEELFRSPDLVVRKVGDHGKSCCVITFDSFTDFREVDRSGFGEAFLDGAGVDAIHIIPRENTWYQQPEMLEAMACVHDATREYARVVSYGSSMGGYAALRFAGVAGATAALALSPQYSIDPALVPWEERWLEPGKHFRPVWEGKLPFPALPEAYVAYDPLNVDRKHIALLAQHMRFESIRLEQGGHPVTGFLAETGMLKRLILSICRNDFDRDAFGAEVSARRTLSPQYFITQADGLAWWRYDKRLALIRQAVDLAPDSATSVRRLAIELRYAKRFDEAIAMHQRSLELAPGHPNMMLQYSLTLERSGALKAALSVQEELYAVTNGAIMYQPRLEALRTMVRDSAGPSAPRHRGKRIRPVAWLMGRFRAAISGW
jgi:tetratricopeptide (TPR) repeat protein